MLSHDDSQSLQHEVYKGEVAQGEVFKDTNWKID